MNAKDTNERQAAFYERKRAAGFVKHSEWVHKEDRKKLAEYAAKLRKKRGGS